jgi:hypothetical protein
MPIPEDLDEAGIERLRTELEARLGALEQRALALVR